MHPRAIRFSEKATKEIDIVAKKRGFSSSSAFIRYAVDQEISVREVALVGAEERLAATLSRCGERYFDWAAPSRRYSPTSTHSQKRF